MPGIVITLGGVSTQYESMLAKSVAQSKAAGAKITSNLQFETIGLKQMLPASQGAEYLAIKKKILDNEREMALDSAERTATALAVIRHKSGLSLSMADKMRVDAAEARAGAPIQGPDLGGVQRQEAAVEKARRDIRARALLRERAEARAARTLASTEEVAATKASQLAQLSVIARGHGAGVATGSHGKTGVSGVVAEVAVLGHEALQGRGFGRILGSVSILGQRIGWLRKIIKTTSDEAVDASAAETKLAQKLAISALAANKSAESKKAEGVAMGLDTAACEKHAAAEIKDAEATTQAALAQELKAKKAQELAEIELSQSKLMGVSPIAAMAGAFIALAVAIGIAAYAYKHLTRAALELKRVMASRATFLEFDKALEKSSDHARELEKALGDLANRQETLADKSQQAIEKIKRQAEAHRELADAQKENQLSQISLDERTGKITRLEAIKKRADIERKALIQASADKQKELDDVAAKRKADFDKAKSDERELGEAAKKAEETVLGGNLSADSREKVNRLFKYEAESKNTENPMWQRSQSAGFAADLRRNLSPEEKKNYDALGRQAKLSALEESESKLREKLKTAQDEVDKSKSNILLPKKLNSTKLWSQGFQSVDDIQNQLGTKSGEIKALKDSMTPDEIAASVARTLAGKATEGRITLGKDANIAKTDADENRNNSAKVLHEKISALENKAKEELLGQIHAPQNLTAMQKIGAFTAQGGNPLIPLHQRTNSLLQQLVNQSKQSVQLQQPTMGGVHH